MLSESNQSEQFQEYFEFQNRIRSENPRITGGFPKEFNPILERTSILLEDFKGFDEYGVDYRLMYGKVEQFSEKLGIGFDEMNNNFIEGLKYEIKAIYRLGLIEDINNENILRKAIIAYTLNFKEVLHSFLEQDLSEEVNVTSDHERKALILAIARKAYTLKPAIYQDLLEQYKDDNVIETWMIKRLIIYNADPEQALKIAKSNFTYLKSKYASDEFIDEGTIKQFIVDKPETIEIRLLLAKRQYLDLLAKYKDDSIIDSSMIKRAVLHNPKNAEDVLEKIKFEVNQVALIYEDEIDSTKIKQIVARNVTNPSLAIQRALNLYEVFSEMYQHNPSVTEENIWEAIIHNPSDVKGFIEKRLAGRITKE